MVLANVFLNMSEIQMDSVAQHQDVLPIVLWVNMDVVFATQVLPLKEINVFHKFNVFKIVSWEMDYAIAMMVLFWWEVPYNAKSVEIMKSTMVLNVFALSDMEEMHLELVLRKI